ncbi:hypothetical protein F2Q70_00042839 [Brassica cretica]|uniref:Secreted protein n=1 Tax=Brassica cretica TaxID=69181 RepID=A0A8S9KC60_BRACR|nr:hypothetical protein F2Q70_00042839 [Brassica cretica]
MAVSGYLWLRMMVVASSTVWRAVAPATSSEDGDGGKEGGDGGKKGENGGVGERSGDDTNQDAFKMNIYVIYEPPPA